MNCLFTSIVRRTACAAALVVVALGAAVQAQSAPNPKTSDLTTPPLSERDRGIFGLDESATTTASQELREALEVFQQQQFDECLERLEAAVKKDAELPPARLLFARMLFAAKQVNPARANLERVATDKPDCPEVHLLFGNLAIAEGRLSDASLQYERAISKAATQNWSQDRLKSFQRGCYAGMTTVAEQRQDWQGANAAILVWLKMDPKDAQAHQRLARVMFYMDQPEEAYKKLQEALTLDSSLEHPDISMGRLCTQQNKLTEAEKWMLSAAKSAPDDSNVRSAVSAWLLDFGRIEEAKEHALAAIALNPNSSALKRLNATIAMHGKDYEEASRGFSELHDEFPDDFFASNYLALSLVESPDEAKRRRAVALAEINARQYQKSPVALSTLGWVYYRVGRIDEAERMLNAAASGGQINSDTAYYLAHVLADRGRLDDVGKLLKSALDSTGRFAFRREAEEWLAKLSGKTSPRRNPSSGSSTTPKEDENKKDESKKDESKPDSSEDGNK